ncbi:vanin-like protein 1 [Teleopsis dalmanni]|uniref:vanin-like protein 1 n=1 Tax=Teleopsis dalmanni TaxID=139649 RepID=UPI0018CD5E3D|nr:vanin-like protein 1 [Teleopsis dalmanni]
MPLADIDKDELMQMTMMKDACVGIEMKNRMEIEIKLNYVFLILTITSLQSKLTLQASLPSDKHYIAGVVEFRPASYQADTTLPKIEENLNSYISIVSSDAAVSTDIIIFPESTLNSDDEAIFIPDPSLEANALCDLLQPNIYHTLLVQLSCAAKKYQKYLLINLTEKENCTTVPEDTRPCSSNGINIFNTNVVFDRSGVIISRYRKVHLYGEKKNTTFIPEYGVFDTDFGVRFGHFICFDILFYSPAQELVDKYDVTDFIFSTMWFSQLPFLTAVQIQSAWSYGNNVNLLAAGASYPPVGTTGTGIYAGRQGALVAKMSTGFGERTLYVANITKKDFSRRLHKRETVPKLLNNPVNNNRLNQNDIFLKRDYLDAYESVILDLSQDIYANRILCYNETFCCNFDLSWKKLNSTANSTYYTYRLGVFDGLRNPVAAELNNMKNCALFSCIGEDIADCGKIFPADVENIEPQYAFERIVIEAKFPTSEKLLIMPNSLKEDLLPVPVNNFVWNHGSDNELHYIRLMLNTTTDNLLTFAAYANYFDENKWKKDSGSIVAVSYFLLFLFLRYLRLHYFFAETQTNFPKFSQFFTNNPWQGRLALPQPYQ